MLVDETKWTEKRKKEKRTYVWKAFMLPNLCVCCSIPSRHIFSVAKLTLWVYTIHEYARTQCTMYRRWMHTCECDYVRRVLFFFFLLFRSFRVVFHIFFISFVVRPRRTFIVYKLHSTVDLLFPFSVFSYFVNGSYGRWTFNWNGRGCDLISDK